MKSPFNFPIIYWFAKGLFFYHDWRMNKLGKLDMKDDKVFAKVYYHHHRSKAFVTVMDNILDLRALELGIKRDKLEL